jgi:hypothetical protein
VAVAASNNPKAGDDRDIAGQRSPVESHINFADERQLRIYKRVLRIKEKIIVVDNRHVLLGMAKPLRLLRDDVVAHLNPRSRASTEKFVTRVGRLVS